MKRTTFKNKKVIQLLNEKFYFVQLNGEEKKTITFLGKKFKFNPTGTTTGTHQLAYELGAINKIISYPTTIILNEKFEIDFQLSSFLNSKKMITLFTNYK